MSYDPYEYERAEIHELERKVEETKYEFEKAKINLHMAELELQRKQFENGDR